MSDPMTIADDARSTRTIAEHYRVVIIGGGNAGLSVAGRLMRRGVEDVVAIEPRTKHLYKPLFSHIAGGTAPASMAVRDQGTVMPQGTAWIQDAVTAIDADTDSLTLGSGVRVGYDHLIVCPGIQHDWDSVPGLAEAMRSPHGASHYEFELAQKASALLKDMRSGTVVFSQPPGAASCAGAAQKPMYLACDYWQRIGVLDDIRVIMVVPDATVFGIPQIDRELERKIGEYGIELRTRSRIVEVDPTQRVVMVQREGREEADPISYDVLNVEPPQSAPDWLKSSTLPATGDRGGFVEVDPRTLRHLRYRNVWALGDAAATTNSKSGGALRRQTLAVAENIAAVLKGETPETLYDGYSVCPFTVSRSSVVFAEFDDSYGLQPTIPFWKGLARERRLTWIFDRHILPWVYWHMILKGRA